MLTLEDRKIAIIGLGYVGLPLAVEFGKKRSTIGYDLNKKRVLDLQKGIDNTREVTKEALQSATHLEISDNIEQLKEYNVYIVTVPTPIDDSKQPDLTPLKKASEMLGAIIKQDDIVIYESTVYPGTTEEVCIPIIEQTSGLTLNKGFYAGYSPERINPGDKERKVHNIVKITSGSTPRIANLIDQLYQEIVTVGTHLASSIKIAEAAKVIENTQRDLNIALINELAIIFNRLGIDTLEVLEAAGSKWNFLPFRPGLVGGHCISVDPYYLTHKAQSTGYHPDIILAGRRINDGMGTYISESVIKLMIKNKISVVDAKILVMGLSFKENCPDIRNTRVTDIIDNLSEYHTNIDIYDPWVNKQEALNEHGYHLLEQLPTENTYDAVIITVAHSEFKQLGVKGIKNICNSKHIIYDVKYVLEKDDVDGRL